jgi:LysR family transcriptional regulator, benzoate and cis,cis-muconate-responsive activator of ben and cat genes
MDLRHLQALVVLAQERHFGRAARRLHVVQSAVTRTIQALEAELGTPLFERDKRQVTLTAAGQVLLVRAQEILSVTELAAQECRAVGQGKRGALRVALSGLSGVGPLPRALARFRRTHPAISIELIRMRSADQVTALLEKRIDLAVSHWSLAHAKLRVTPLQTQRLQAVLPAEHRLACAPAVAWTDLLQEVHVVLSRAIEPEVARAVQELLGDPPAPGPSLIEVDDISLMFTLVAAGLGISHLPEDAARIAFPGVVAVPIEPTVRLTLMAAHVKSTPSPQVLELLTYLRST